MEIYLELILSNFREIPVLERPREKAIRFGLDTLSNDELIAVLIGTGTKQESVLELAHKINSQSNGLSNLFNVPYEALLDINGIGPVKALILSACFELCNRYLKTFYGDSGTVSTLDIYNRYALKMRQKDKELFALVVLNRRRQIIHEEFLYVGSETHVACQPKEIIRKVMLHNGNYFYMIHNHPSGDCIPSKEDVNLTTQVKVLANQLSVRLLDHIIVGDTGFYSFSEYEECVKLAPNL